MRMHWSPERARLSKNEPLCLDLEGARDPESPGEDWLKQLPDQVFVPMFDNPGRFAGRASS